METFTVLHEYHNPEEHPRGKLLDAGVRITLNRDDPTFLNLTLTEELMRCKNFAELSASDILQTQYFAMDAAFCGDSDKRQLRAALDAFSERPQCCHQLKQSR